MFILQSPIILYQGFLLKAKKVTLEIGLPCYAARNQPAQWLLKPTVQYMARWEITQKARWTFYQGKGPLQKGLTCSALFKILSNHLIKKILVNNVLEISRYKDNKDILFNTKDNLFKRDQRGEKLAAYRGQKKDQALWIFWTPEVQPIHETRKKTTLDSMSSE